jgi:hypothetical protein
VIAFGQLHPADVVDMLYCDPGHAGMGVGGRLLAAMEARAMDTGQVVIDTKASLVACRFFASHGYQSICEEVVTRNGINIPRHSMRKLLAPPYVSHDGRKFETFPPPRSTRNWASEATFGERIWLKRKLQPIPREHDRLARILTLLAASGMPMLVWGIWKLEPWPTTLGLFVTYTGKLWFLDRMVWLYRDTAVSKSEAHSGCTENGTDAPVASTET